MTSVTALTLLIHPSTVQHTTLQHDGMFESNPYYTEISTLLITTDKAD
jgi:hypothetical protein